LKEVLEERKEEENRPAILPAVFSYTRLNITFASGKNNFQSTFRLEFHIFWKNYNSDPFKRSVAQKFVCIFQL